MAKVNKEAVEVVETGVDLQVVETADEVKAAIELASRNARNSQEEIQQVAIRILRAAYHSGRFGLATVLINDLPEGVRKAALVAWFSKFLCGAVIDEESGKFTGKPDTAKIEQIFRKAVETKWWTLKPENPWGGFDLAAELAKLVKKAAKANEKARTMQKAGEITAEQSAELCKIDEKQLKLLQMMAGKVAVTDAQIREVQDIGK